MDTTAALLDRAKDVLAITSDYELARRLGVSQPAVANYRNGTSKPEPAIVGLLAEIIGQDPLSLIAIIEGERENARRSPRPKVVEFWKRHSPRLFPAIVLALAAGIQEQERTVSATDLTLRALPAIHYAYRLLSLLRTLTGRSRRPSRLRRLRWFVRDPEPLVR